MIEPTWETLSLRTMRPGETGRVTGLSVKNGAARRLAEFGFVRGARVEMIRSGAPCIIRLDQTRLGLGAALQDGVLMALEDRKSPR